MPLNLIPKTIPTISLALLLAGALGAQTASIVTVNQAETDALSRSYRAKVKADAEFEQLKEAILVRYLVPGNWEFNADFTAAGTQPIPSTGCGTYFVPASTLGSSSNSWPIGATTSDLENAFRHP